jgi:CheY-like chemotaxis protein
VSRTVLRALGRPAVLLVDDHEEHARVTADGLRALGLRVDALSDGAAALERIEDRSIDVCVVDLVMRGVSGAEVVERLRARHSDVAAIVISEQLVPELLQRAVANGAFACLRKPVAAPDLAQVVAEARGRAQMKAVTA